VNDIGTQQTAYSSQATVTDCFKTKQTWRRATQSKSCLRVENMAVIFIFKWKSIYLKQD
jgi:hypothetical protein